MKKIVMTGLALLSLLIGKILIPLVQVQTVNEYPVEFDKDLAKKGEILFKRYCYVCHDDTSSERKKSGPPLWGIYGRSIAYIENYKYSKAFKRKINDVVWTDETLDQFLYLPKNFVPGN